MHLYNSIIITSTHSSKAIDHIYHTPKAKEEEKNLRHSIITFYWCKYITRENVSYYLIYKKYSLKLRSGSEYMAINQCQGIPITNWIIAQRRNGNIRDTNATFWGCSRERIGELGFRDGLMIKAHWSVHDMNERKAGWIADFIFLSGVASESYKNIGGMSFLSMTQLATSWLVMFRHRHDETDL